MLIIIRIYQYSSEVLKIIFYSFYCFILCYAGWKECWNKMCLNFSRYRKAFAHSFCSKLIRGENTRYLTVAEDNGHPTPGRSSERVPSLGQTSQRFQWEEKDLHLSTACNKN